MFFTEGAWVAQSAEHLTSARVMISRFVGSSPALGSGLTARSLEPASNSVSPSLSTPLILCLSLSLSLSQKWINVKNFFLKNKWNVLNWIDLLGCLSEIGCVWFGSVCPSISSNNLLFLPWYNFLLFFPLLYLNSEPWTTANTTLNNSYNQCCSLVIPWHSLRIFCALSTRNHSKNSHFTCPQDISMVSMM